jgi:hypothetical protein
MINFTVRTAMTEEAWKDHIFGSGADTWEWWADLYQNPSGDVVIKYFSDPDEYDSDVQIHYTTLTRLADTASKMAQRNDTIRRSILNDDFDADAMDLVLQTEVFGEIIYG